MSEVRVNKLSPRSGTTVTLGDSGDTITIPSGVTFDASSGGLAGTLTTAAQPNITSVGTLTSFASTGIDDNATSTAITIDSSQRVGIGGNPSSALDVRNTNPIIQTVDTDNSNAVCRFDGNGGNLVLRADNNNNVASTRIGFTIDGSEKMRIDSNGNVGIGTSSPGTKLDILATGYNASAISTTVSDYAIKLAGATTSSYFSNGLIFSEGTLARSAIGSFDGGSSGRQGLWFATHNGTSMAERVRIDSSGNVGIGTSSPSTNLEIAEASTPKIRFSRTGAYYWDIGHTNSDFQFESQTGGVIMHMNFDGNVGIGTTSPSTNLDISSSGDATINLKASGQSNGLQLSQLTADGGSSISATNNNYLKFSTNATERMRIDSSGNVGIGTSSPTQTLHILNGTSSGGLIEYDGQSNSEFGLRIQSNISGGNFESDFVNGTTALLDLFANSSTVSGGDLLVARTQSATPVLLVKGNGKVGIGTSSPSANLNVVDSRNATETEPHFRINGAGYSGFHWLNLTAYYIGQNSNSRSLRIYSGSNEAVGAQLSAGGNSFGTFSDERLKKNITDLTNGLDKISAIRAVKFKYKTDADDYRNRIGIIAQSLVGQVDEALDQSQINETDTTQYYNVRYQDLIPVLIKALQEAKTKIEQLETRIQTLENA